MPAEMVSSCARSIDSIEDSLNGVEAMTLQTRASIFSDLADISVEEQQNESSEPAGQHQKSQESESDIQAVDLTKYPTLLDTMYETLDPQSSVRPTIIHPGKVWHKTCQKALLGSTSTETLAVDAQTKEKDAAFDLLDALTRSGALPVEHASLHVIIAATHCFDQSLMDTLVKKNINPIERVERTTLIMGSVLHSVSASELVHASQLPRVATYSPQLF